MKKSSLLYISILISVPVVVSIAATFVLGVNGYDGWVHLNWLDQFSAMVRDGDLYPRWLQKSFFGFGSPSFYFYPPLPYWAGAIISLLTTSTSPEFLYYAVSWLAIVLSFYSMRYVLRVLYYKDSVVLLLAILYSLNIYRILDLFSRNSMGEQFAFVFLPLVFLSAAALTSAIRISDRTFFFCTVIGWSGTLLCNIPTFVLMAISTVVLLVISHKQISTKQLHVFLASSVTSMLLCGIYLIPIIYFKDSVHLEHLIFKDADILPLGRSFLGQTPYPDIVISKYCCFAVGIILLYVLYRYYFNSDKGDRNIAPLQKLLFAWCSLAVLFQIPIVGNVLHKNIFPFTIIQLYWRWDILIMLCLPFVVGATVLDKKFNIVRNSILTTISLGGILVLIVSYQLRGGSPSDLPGTSHQDVDEYIPRSVPYTGKQILSSHDELTKGTFSLPITINSDSTQSISFHKFYWYDNIVLNDSMEVTTYPDSLGRLTAQIPPGNNSLRISDKTLPPELYGILSSIIGIVAIVVIGKALKSKT
ncbi:MAG TPA: hypothetical protein VIX80_09155 [Candidatus Kapabacteria bacterium]